MLLVLLLRLFYTTVTLGVSPLPVGILASRKQRDPVISYLYIHSRPSGNIGPVPNPLECVRFFASSFGFITPFSHDRI